MNESMPTVSPKRDDLYVYAPNGMPEVFIQVTRVSPARWVDIRCHTWAVSWGKRIQGSSLPEGFIRRDWSQADLDEQEARWESLHLGASQ